VDVVIGVRYYWRYAEEGNERSYIDRKDLEQLGIQEMHCTEIVVSLHTWSFKCINATASMRMTQNSSVEVILAIYKTR